MSWILLTLFFFFLILCIFFAFPWIYGAPFEPTSNKKLKQIIKLANIKKSEKAVDLGSGDGRIVIEIAKKGAEAHGFEINPFLVFLSRRKIKKQGLENKAFIHWKNFWKEDLGEYDLIVMFQFSTIMKRLEKKLKKELKPSARIISYYWKFPNWKIKNKKENIFVYQK
ncbi:SAM-dependent methyltransferase [Candidatus Pacearchaeota archaeon]|nr:MAG: SAM-dependent methyltransferase [Candidatus Pacearchaeota archaeon]